MKPSLARLLVRLYPRRWQARYGAEFQALLETGSHDLRTAANVLRSALSEHLFPTQGDPMKVHPQSFGAMTKQPSAFLPMAMSLTALAVIFIGPLLFHDLHATDEGPTAHLWQILMAGQIPVVAFFVIRWLPRAAKQTLQVLALQTGALLTNIAVVFFLGLG